MIVICQSFVLGYCKLTGHVRPTKPELEQLSKSMFQITVVKVETQLNITEVVGWVESNYVALTLFNRFGRN